MNRVQCYSFFESHDGGIHLTDVRFFAVTVLELLDFCLAGVNLSTRCSIVTSFERLCHIVLPGLGFLADDVVGHDGFALVFQGQIER